MIGTDKNIYEEMRLLVNKVSDNPNRYYPLNDGKKLLEKLKAGLRFSV